MTHHSDDEWECVESMVDSGAARSVCPLTMCQEVGVARPHEGPAFFRTATGDRVQNHGIRELCGISNEGTALSLAYNVAEVSAPLDSVSQICDRGNVVVFTQAGGFVCGPQGKLAFKRKNDTYVRQTWVRRGSPPRSSPVNKSRQRNVRETSLDDAMDVNGMQRDFHRQVCP